MNNKITVNIHGSCVTRDSFKLFDEDSGLSIRKYVSRNSIFSVISEPLELNECEYTTEEKPYLKRMISVDFKKDLFRIYEENPSDYLIIDLIDERFNLLSFVGDKQMVITNSSNFSKSDILASHPVYSKLDYVLLDTWDFSKGLMKKAIDEYARRISEIYNKDQIIINETYLAGHYKGTDGKYHCFPEERLNQYIRINTKLRIMYRYLINALNVDSNHIISQPEDNYAWEENKWGLAPFHFTDEYYNNVKNRFLEIVEADCAAKQAALKTEEASEVPVASNENKKIGFLGKLKQNQFLFEELVKRDFTKKYKRTILGIFWSVLGPLLTLSVMALVFTQFFGRNMKHYIIYLFCGYLLFNYYKEATTTGMTSLKDNAQIFSKVSVPKYMFLLSKNVSTLINFGINVIVLLVFCVIDGVTFTWKFILLIYPISCLIVFNLGCGLILSALYIMFRDMKYLYDVFSMLLMYVSAIFYTVESYPEHIQKLFYLNPIFVNIRYFRMIILEGKVPSLAVHILAAFYAVVVLLIGALIYKKKNYKFLYYI